MKFAPLIDPAVRKPAPKPVRVDLRKVFAIGTGLWIVALIVVLILLAVGYSVMPLVIMCVAGVIIGLLLLVWGILRPLGLPPPRTVTQHKLSLMTGAVSVAD